MLKKTTYKDISMALSKTEFSFKNQSGFYKGKVRDVYNLNNGIMVMIVTDRISAFDVILPKPIPHKGQILNKIAYKMLENTKDIVPNWLIASPHANCVIGKLCEPYKVEMVVRAYLCGSAWRNYKTGQRTICGVTLPDGLRENQQLSQPIITPTTKASEGHDMDISREEIIAQGIISKEDYLVIEKYAIEVFNRGTQLAKQKGLILVDTKFEFGKDKDGNICLIDEILTPDSSRYFYANTYDDLFKNNQPQRQLSKEFVREWLIANNFQGKDGQVVPEMTDEIIKHISERYIELYEIILAEKFVPEPQENLFETINTYLEK
jgi:phosphoribosylaminoimidazole-succinocarboxamide synthase